MSAAIMLRKCFPVIHSEAHSDDEFGEVVQTYTFYVIFILNR